MLLASDGGLSVAFLLQRDTRNKALYNTPSLSHIKRTEMLKLDRWLRDAIKPLRTHLTLERALEVVLAGA